MTGLEISTDLPNLPRVLKKREAAITPRIEKWLMENWIPAYVYEIKIKGNKEKVHQKRDLNKAARGQASWKLSDATIGKLPFDGFGVGMKGIDALVITYDPKTKYMSILRMNTGVTKTFKL